MRTKILYVIVSGPEDYYMEQLLVSVYSARHHNPLAHIEILMDNSTFATLPERGELSRNLQNLSSNMTVVDLDPALSAKMRSRILKTGMRMHVKGDFLYLDCDTVVTGPLDAIDTLDCSLAACRDTHCLFKDNPYRESDIQSCLRIGIDISGENEFFNGGVMYSRDDETSRSFFQKWNSIYLEGVGNGITQDQPSLCKANITIGRKIQVLDDIWNCEIKHGVRFLKDALVVHYLCGSPDPGREFYSLNDRNVLREIRVCGCVPDDVAALADNPFLGIPPVTQLFAGGDLRLFRTLRFRHLRAAHRKGRGSVMEFLLKVYYHFTGYGKL